MSLSGKSILHLELDERRSFSPDRQVSIFTHSHFHRLIARRWDVGGGFTYQSSSIGQLYVPEYRPFLEASFSFVQKQLFQLSLRYRLDNRFIHHNSGTELSAGYNFIQRHRFRIQGSYHHTFSESFNCTFRLANETMINSSQGDRIFDQMRNYGGVEVQLTKPMSIESGYVHIYQSRGATDFQIRNVWRTTLYYRFSPRKNRGVT